MSVHALEPLLRSAYAAFNARDIDAAVELMHPDVDWPNAWRGGRVVGRAAVRDYWTVSSPPSPAASNPRASPRSPTAASLSTCTKSSTTRGRAISSPTQESGTATELRTDLSSGWMSWRATPMNLELINFDSPTEVRKFEKGKFETYRVGPMTLGRAT